MSTAVRGGPLATIVVRWTCCGSRTPIAARAWTCGPMPRIPGCRPATTGARRATSTGRTAGPGLDPVAAAGGHDRDPEVAGDRDDVAAAVDGGSGERLGHGLDGEAVDRYGERLALRSRGQPRRFEGPSRRGGRRNGRGPRVRARRVEDGGPLVRRRGPSQDGGPDHRDEQQDRDQQHQPGEDAATPRRGVGGYGRRSSLADCTRSRRPRMPLPSDAMTAIPELRNVDPPVLAGNDARPARPARPRPPGCGRRGGRRRGPDGPVGGPSRGRAGGERRPARGRADRLGRLDPQRRLLPPGVQAVADRVRRLHGVERAETLYRETIEAFEHVERLCTTPSTPSSTAPATSCSPLRPRTRPPSTARSTRCAGWAWRRTWCRGRAADRDRQRRVLRRARRGAERRANPARLTLGLADLAEAAGAVLHEETRATRILPQNDGRSVVETSRGAVIATNVIVGTNGYTGGLTPRCGAGSWRSAASSS